MIYCFHCSHSCREWWGESKNLFLSIGNARRGNWLVDFFLNDHLGRLIWCVTLLAGGWIFSLTPNSGFAKWTLIHQSFLSQFSFLRREIVFPYRKWQQWFHSTSFIHSGQLIWGEKSITLHPFWLSLINFHFTANVWMLAPSYLETRNLEGLHAAIKSIYFLLW